MPSHLNPDEKNRLDQIEAALDDLAAQASPLKAEKRRLLGLARWRRHSAKQA